MIVNILARLSAACYIWPQPVSFETGSAVLVFSNAPAIAHDCHKCSLIEAAIARFNDQFSALRSKNCSQTAEMGLPMFISVQSPSNFKLIDTDESYSLSVDNDGIKISAKTTFGAMYGLDSLIQLFEVKDDRVIIPSIPIKIMDFPRFQHRGLLVDTSRHYISVSKLKEVLVGMAMSKLNVLHWHIIDSQSFPYESSTFPELSREGAHKDSVYRNENVVDIIGFANDLGIRVIPEFDMPGHTRSIGMSHPELIVCADAKPWDKFCAEPPWFLII
jgi:hexosaminidase